MSKSLDSFKESLARIRDIINDMNANASLALKDSTVRTRYETIRCAAMVILSGFLESFLRNVADEFVAELCSRAVPFDNLPGRIRATHFRGGADILYRRAGKEKNTSPMSESARLVQRLASVVSSVPYELISEAFGETRANPGIEVVREFLGRFGIDQPGDRLAQVSGFPQNSLETVFKSFMALRNECAHTGTAGNVPPGTEISGYCDFLERVAAAIIDILNTHFALPPLGVAPIAAPAPLPGLGPGAVNP